MFLSVGYQQSSMHILMQMLQSYDERFKNNYMLLCEFFSEHPVGLHAWHYPQPTLPILSNAMPKHKLMLHIAIAACFRPSDPGCKVLLNCNQYKTVILKVSLILTSSTICLHVYETENEVYVSEDCCCCGTVILL